MGTDTVACMTSQVEAINGTMQVLQGGYAAVSGYTYATPACTGTSLCKNQDLDKLAAALEETPVSVCVNVGAWNAYTGGVMTSAACGSMAAFEQDRFQHHRGNSLLDCEDAVSNSEFWN